MPAWTQALLSSPVEHVRRFFDEPSGIPQPCCRVRRVGRASQPCIFFYVSIQLVVFETITRFSNILYNTHCHIKPCYAVKFSLTVITVPLTPNKHSRPSHGSVSESMWTRNSAPTLYNKIFIKTKIYFSYRKLLKKSGVSFIMHPRYSSDMQQSYLLSASQYKKKTSKLSYITWNVIFIQSSGCTSDA